LTDSKNRVLVWSFSYTLMLIATVHE